MEIKTGFGNNFLTLILMDWPMDVSRVPIRVSHVAIGESSKELAKPNLWILAILAKSLFLHK